MITQEDIKKVVKKVYGTEDLKLKCSDSPFGKLCVSTDASRPLICVINDFNGKKMALCKTDKDGKTIEIQL